MLLILFKDVLPYLYFSVRAAPDKSTWLCWKKDSKEACGELQYHCFFNDSLIAQAQKVQKQKKYILLSRNNWAACIPVQYFFPLLTLASSFSPINSFCRKKFCQQTLMTDLRRRWALSSSSTNRAAFHSCLFQNFPSNLGRW